MLTALLWGAVAAASLVIGGLSGLPVSGRTSSSAPCSRSARAR